MEGERRRLRLLRLVAERAGASPAQRLCEVCAEVTGATGAGIMLVNTGVPAGAVCTTDERSALIEDLQFSLGEGPGVDAHRTGHPVLVPDLSAMAEARWLGFIPQAIAAGVGGVFGFPLRIGEARLGALHLYREQRGSLTDEQHADALVLADIASRAVLDLQAHAPMGRLAPELEDASDLQYAVHQATGMVAAQLEIGVADALVRLRAHAFGNGRSLRQVAEDVVARRMRFEQGTGECDSIS